MPTKPSPPPSPPGPEAAPDDLPARVAASIRTHGLLAAGDRVLVAVSGGADSTALAALLARTADRGLPLDLVLAHLDHGWRGPAAAAADRAAVAALADRLRVPLLLAGPPDPPARTEDLARRWRYGRLATLARAAGAATVATGHHAGDQAETVWLRLERASGPSGLRGIPRERPLGEGGVRVVRPLLDEDPAGLRAWLATVGLPWREDPTNLDPARDRARARLALAAQAARGRDTGGSLVALARDLGARLARREAALLAGLETALLEPPGAGAVGLPRTALRGLHPADLDLLLRALGRRIGADRSGPWLLRRHVARIGALLERGGALDLPRGLAFAARGRSAWLRWRHAPPTERAVRLERTDVDARRFDLPGFLQRRQAAEAALDAGPLGPSPALRPVAAGDRFVPYGAGSRRVVRVLAWLAHQGVPGWLRRRTLVLEGAGGVAWVVGRRVDHAHAVGPETARVARLRVRPAQGPAAPAARAR